MKIRDIAELAVPARPARGHLHIISSIPAARSAKRRVPWPHAHRIPANLSQQRPKTI